MLTRARTSHQPPWREQRAQPPTNASNALLEIASGFMNSKSEHTEAPSRSEFLTAYMKFQL